MRLFTLEEANELLPEISRLFRSIDESRGLLVRLEPEVKKALKNATECGGTSYGLQYAGALSQFMSSVEEIFSLGVEIKDFDSGLCDFPSERDGRIVYLCWKRGENSIEWWHDIDAGFTGRQRL